MKVSLVYNPTAGSGQEAGALVDLLTAAGHDVVHRSSKDDWQDLLQDPGDLMVAAGGDGTVRKILLAAAEHGVPFAILPTGTANNIAKTIGIMGDAAELVDSWSRSTADQRRFDIGEAIAPWGRQPFVESVGGGAFAELVGRGEDIRAEASLLGRETDRAIQLLADIVRKTPARPWQIAADGMDLSGDYLAVEVLNTRFVGPNVPIAPVADPTDGRFDAVLFSEADREVLLEYLDQRLRLASGALPALNIVQARRVELVSPAGIRWHVDDESWPSAQPLREPAPIEVRCRAGAATFMGGTA